MRSKKKLLSLWGLILLTIMSLVLSTCLIAATESETQKLEVGSQAEWFAPKTILMHTPGDEAFWGVIHPAAALFEKPFSSEEAATEHRNYIERLRNEGAIVYTVVGTLLDGTVDEKGQVVHGPQLDELREFAKEFLTIDSSLLPDDIQHEQIRYKEKVLASLSPYELVGIIMLRPTVHLYPTESNTGFEAKYRLEPVMNLYFTRDQMITTAKGVVICRMHSDQRAPETKIIKFVLSKLGIEPIYEVTGNGCLEGGDYFSAGDTALIGQGLRTNAEGIRQLLENQVFGLPRVVVVKDPWKNQEEMHLDTYFNLISHNLAVLVKLRMDTPGKPADEKMCSRVDVYELENDGYQLKIQDYDFQKYLEEELGFTLIPVSRDDQLLYGINFLTVGPNRILAIDGVSEEYKKTLSDYGVNAVWMDFHALTCGYGAAHCTTQVLLRESPTTGAKSLPKR